MMASPSNVTLSTEPLARYVSKVIDGKLDGKKLASMESDGEISKSDRRKITRAVPAELKRRGKEEAEKNKVLSERQKLRLEVKAKKALPKLTKDDRKVKYVDERLEKERDAISARFLVCLGCRKKGHLLKECPHKKKYDSRNEMCFNCGSYDHALRACPLERVSGLLPYASCFICKQNGHIARDCPENANGLYPKGGCCHICLQKSHLARDCPQRTEEDAENARKRRIQQQMREETLYGPKVKGLTEEEYLADDVDVDADDKSTKKKSKKARLTGDDIILDDTFEVDAVKENDGEDGSEDGKPFAKKRKVKKDKRR